MLEMNKSLSDYKIKKIMRFFCEDITASKTAILLGINRNTINRYFNLFRQKITAQRNDMGSLFSGEIELDESYFGARQILYLYIVVRILLLSEDFDSMKIFLEHIVS